jgi:SanA protein
MTKKKLLLICLVSATVIICAVTYVCNKVITDNASGKLFSDVNAIPFNRVGLLLGTSKTGRSDNSNPYYDYRIEAAARLIKSGKIKYLIISGDNSRASYNEPAAMRGDLILAGIDSSIIYLDYAGFRTFDSIVRLKEIFGQDSATIISQQFHNERAIYTAGRLGISAIAFNATGVSGQLGLRVQIREKFARVKTFLDFWFGTRPKFLGSKIIIPA